LVGQKILVLTAMIRNGLVSIGVGASTGTGGGVNTKSVSKGSKDSALGLAEVLNFK